MHPLSKLYLAILTASLSTQALASDFSLPFVNSAGLGVAYADWATAASDASTAYTNPAGLVNIKKRQLVVNALGIFGDSKFTGTSTTPSFPFPFAVQQSGTAKTQIGNFSPSFFYAAPLSERTVFGFNVTAPFGLGTNYANTSIVRYAATRSTVAAIDVGPSIGVKPADFISFGAGFDAVYLAFQLNNMYGPPLSFIPPFSFVDQTLENKLSGWGYGWHAGTLINIASQTKVGLSYNSHVTIKTTGHSSVYTPTNTEIRTDAQLTKSTLPARAQLSVHQGLTERLTGLFTVFYTNWKTFSHITMENTMTPSGQPISVTIPFNYRNTFDYSIGATFQSTEKLLLRAGVQILDAPSNNIDRSVVDPIGNATIATIGAHYKASDTLSFDVGVGHSFFKQMQVNFINPLTTVSGHTNTQTTVVGGQVNWTID